MEKTNARIYIIVVMDDGTVLKNSEPIEKEIPRGSRCVLVAKLFGKIKNIEL